MKQTNIQFDFDCEKLEAIKLFLSKKNSTLEAELIGFTEQLYRKNVPANVRGYIGMRSGQEISDTSKPLRNVSAHKSRSEPGNTSIGKIPDE